MEKKETELQRKLREILELLEKQGKLIDDFEKKWKEKKQESKK